MTPKVQSLFNLGAFEKRKTPEQESFIDENISLIKCFSEAVDYAFVKLHNEVFKIFKPYGMDNKLPAIAVSSLIREYLIDNQPIACRKATLARFKLTGQDGQSIYVKKLDDNKLPSNVETDANDMILYQLTDSRQDSKANIFFGYRTDPGFPQVKDKFIVCLDGKKIVWEQDIATINENAIYYREKVNAITKLKEGVVKLKEKRK